VAELIDQSGIMASRSSARMLLVGIITRKEICGSALGNCYRLVALRASP
jgi:hypothetical protein